MSTKEKIQESVQTQTKDSYQHEIVLHNDDVNTFDHVIDCLVAICNHTAIQAEQCATLVHYKGKCGVKSGSYKDLEPMCSQLLDLDLSAELI